MRNAWLAVLLAALSLTHILAFGWRVMHVRKTTPDSFNYIEVARNLSAGEGFAQSAPGFNQPGFWGEDFSSNFPSKNRSAHNLGYPLAIFAVAELTGIEHADATFLIGALSYLAVFALSFALGFRLWGVGAGLLSASMIMWLNGRSVFWHALTEPLAVAFLLGALLLLVSRARGASFAVAGVLSGLAFIQRAAMLPLMGAGVLAAAMQKEKKARYLAFYLLGAAVGAVRFLLEGGSEQSVYPLRPVREIFHSLSHDTLLLLREMGPSFAVLGALGLILRWRQIKEARAGQDRGRLRFLFTRGEIVLLSWVLGYLAFLLAVFSISFVADPIFSSRYLYPAKIAALILGAGLLWRALPASRGRMIFAASVFALSIAVNIVRDRAALKTKPSGSDVAKIASSELLRWADVNISSNDLVVGVNVVDFPYYFDHIDSAVSYSPFFPYVVKEEQIAAIVRRRCDRRANFYLVVARNSREQVFGPYLNRLIAGEPVDDAIRVADLRDGLVYRLTYCDGD